MFKNVLWKSVECYEKWDDLLRTIIITETEGSGYNDHYNNYDYYDYYNNDYDVDECDTDWTWTIWEKEEKGKDGYFTLAIYRVKTIM